MRLVTATFVEAGEGFLLDGRANRKFFESGDSYGRPVLPNIDNLAEEEGFEPPCESPRKRFSRPPVSTAHPFLQTHYRPPRCCASSSSLASNAASRWINSAWWISPVGGVLP